MYSRRPAYYTPVKPKQALSKCMSVGNICGRVWFTFHGKTESIEFDENSHNGSWCTVEKLMLIALSSLFTVSRWRVFSPFV